MSENDINLDELLESDAFCGRPPPEGVVPGDPTAVAGSTVEKKDIRARHELADPNVSLSSEITPEDMVALNLDLLSWDQTPIPSVPRFSPMRVSLLLNMDVVPILAADGIQEELVLQLNQYAERLNGYRMIQQAVSQTVMHRASLMNRYLKDKRHYRTKKAQLRISIAGVKDERTKKPKYSNETAREAELIVRINNDGELRALDERIFEDEVSVKGFDARMEALKQEAKPLERELDVARDMINHLVNTGMIAIAHFSENFANGEEEVSDGEGEPAM